jgi:hypothetical protein
MGRIFGSRCTSHVSATASDRILAAYRFRLLVSSPIAVSRSAFRQSSTTYGSGVLAVANAMGSSTKRAGTAAIRITSIEDNAALTYDFHAT